MHLICFDGILPLILTVFLRFLLSIFSRNFILAICSINSSNERTIADRLFDEKTCCYFNTSRHFQNEGTLFLLSQNSIAASVVWNSTAAYMLNESNCKQEFPKDLNETYDHNAVTFPNDYFFLFQSYFLTFVLYEELQCP